MGAHGVEQLCENAQLLINGCGKVLIPRRLLNSPSDDLPQILISSWHQKRYELQPANLSNFSLVKPCKHICHKFFMLLSHQFQKVPNCQIPLLFTIEYPKKLNSVVVWYWCKYLPKTLDFFWQKQFLSQQIGKNLVGFDGESVPLVVRHRLWFGFKLLFSFSIKF